MIPISLEFLPVAYVAIGLGIITTIWLLGALRKGLRSKKSPPAIRCAACGTVFEPVPVDDLPRCPTCGHPNERSPAKFF